MTAASTQVTSLLTQFGLTTAAEELVPRLTEAGHPEALPVLVEVFEAEAEARRQRRVTRLRRASRLPPGKTFATLDTGRLPAPVAQQLETLASGAFLETATNVLAFGLPGVGKSHALCAVGHALVEAGHSVLCAPAYALVQELLGAKRDLDLPRALRKLDLFELILLDDLGLRPAKSRRSRGAVHAARRALRAPFGDGDEQPGVQPVGPDLPRPDGHGRGDRPPGPPRGRARVRRAELPNGPVPPEIAAGACPPRACSRSAAAPGPPPVNLVNVRPVPGAEPPFPGPLRNGIE